MSRAKSLVSTDELADQAHEQLAPRIDWSEIGPTEHLVQFYENDSFLIDSVANYIRVGLCAGEGAVVILTRAHREALERVLQEDGLNLAAARARGEYFPFDAADTLVQFMGKDVPDEKLFAEVVGGLVKQASHGGRKLRAFGEMVALLWSEGRHAGAIQLEELWNELARTQTFALFCAYPMKDFCGEERGLSFKHICKAHSRVIPAESYAAQPSVDERLRTVSLLQQKASSLAAEVAERKEAEAALRKQQAKLAMAIAVARLGTWELAMNSNALECSDQCKAIFGLRPEEPLTYERLFELIHPEDRAGARSGFEQAIADGNDYQAEYRVINSAGEVRWVTVSGRCFPGAGDDRVLGAMQDITDQRRTAEMLECTVRERTRQLEETIAELETFSYSISHDIRSPLRAMNGYAQSLLDEYTARLDATAVSRLERIQRVSGRLDLLIRDVLAYSRVVNGQIELQAIELAPLVEDIIVQHPDFEGARSCFTIESPLHTVIGHEAYLTQCLTNLIANALKFVPSGQAPQVRIRSEVAEGKVRVWISDSGIGIHPDHHSRIFKMFGRVHSDKVYEGTGIGLAIVRKAVMRMGGDTGFQSEHGKGAHFWFSLPQAAAGN